jgi:hypothetical protein
VTAKLTQAAERSSKPQQQQQQQQCEWLQEHWLISLDTTQAMSKVGSAACVLRQFVLGLHLMCAWRNIVTMCAAVTAPAPAPPAAAAALLAL